MTLYSLLLLYTTVLQADVWRASPDTVTVGDTVTIAAAFEIAPEDDIRAPVIESNDLFQLLETPQLGTRGAAVTVTYRVAFFVPGEHTIRLPALEVLQPGGSSDSIAAGSVTVLVASVLPATDTLLHPKWSRPPIGRTETRVKPLVAFVVVVLATTLAWGVVRRRRRLIPSRTSRATPVEPDLDQWIAAGEPRAVACIVTNRLRATLASFDSRLDRGLSTEECIEILEDGDFDVPVRDLTGLLRTLDRARFAPAVASAVEELVQRVDELVAELVSAPSEESSAV